MTPWHDLRPSWHRPRRVLRHRDQPTDPALSICIAASAMALALLFVWVGWELRGLFE